MIDRSTQLKLVLAFTLLILLSSTPAEAKKDPIATIKPGESVTILILPWSQGIAVDSVKPGRQPGKYSVIVSFTEDGEKRCLQAENMSKYILYLDFAFQYQDASPLAKRIPLFGGSSGSACQDKLKPVSISILRLAAS